MIDQSTICLTTIVPRFGIGFGFAADTTYGLIECLYIVTLAYIPFP